MLQRSDQFSFVPQNLNSSYLIIESELKEVEQILREELSDGNPFIDEVVSYAFQLGGKRLRPVLLLLTGKSLGPITREHLLLATAIEMIHTATLIHDDILDGALFRRHLQTMNLKWNAGISVMAGDYILSKAMEVVTKLEEIQPYRILSFACGKTCYGELYQLGTRTQFDMSVDEYYRMIAAKTAALLEAACHLGAIQSTDNPDFVQIFREFGKNLGMAFQIVDDLLDIVGDESKTGKTLGTDIAQKKPTLPLILHLESLAPEARQETIEQIHRCSHDPDFVQEMLERMKASGALEATTHQAGILVEKATEQLEQLPKSEIFSPKALESLRLVARFVVERNL